jgi:natural resistance-associated macrophage protein
MAGFVCSRATMRNTSASRSVNAMLDARRVQVPRCPTDVVTASTALGSSSPSLTCVRRASQASDSVSACLCGRVSVSEHQLGASALAAAVVPLSTAYAISEAEGAECSAGRRLREAPLFLGLLAAQIFIGAAVALVPGNLNGLLINAQLVNGIITPILLTYVLILANRRRLLRDAANGPAYRGVATLCVAVIAIMATATPIATLIGWFGIR